MKLFSKRLLAFAFTWIVFQSFGQEKGTNEISAGVGFLTTNDILTLGTTTAFFGVISSGNVTYSEKQLTIPAIGLGYKRALADRWMLGLDAYYQSHQSEVYINNIPDGSLRDAYFTIGVGTDFHYISTSWFQMYSGVGVAYTFNDTQYTGTSNELSDSQTSFLNFHINALGFRFGKAFALFAELGFGYKGIVHAGVSIQL